MAQRPPVHPQTGEEIEPMTAARIHDRIDQMKEAADKGDAEAGECIERETWMLTLATIAAMNPADAGDAVELAEEAAEMASVWLSCDPRWY